jgi:cytochrome c-type biogenesis protein CcmH/NrfF
MSGRPATERASGRTPESGSRRRRGAAPTTLLLIAAALIAGAAIASLTVRGTPGATTLQDRVRAVGQTLRCPSCSDLSVADSPSAIAGEIRADIARRLGDGQSPERIRAYYVGRYGPWILLSPPASGVTLFAWLIPGLLVATGLVVAAVAVFRWTRRAPETAAGSSGSGSSHDTLGPSDRRLLDRALGTPPEEPA